MSDPVQRTLAALLAADVISYSSLMESDEAATLAGLKALRSGLLEPVIAAHGGRIFKLTGDGLFATFSSVVQATEASVAIQQSIARDGDTHLRLRIGVHLGDVIIDGDDLYGDGVNITARLEGIAPHGGVCLSAAVYDHLTGPLAARFSTGGDRTLKNISRPISTFVWEPEGAATDSKSTPGPVAVPADHKPRLVVKAFEGSSPDSEAVGLAGSVTDAVTAGFSRMTGFVLLDDASSADFVVTGNIQVRGNRYRATVHTTEACTRTHLWSQRYDGEIADLFDAEDELAFKIITGIRTRLIKSAVDRAATDLPDEERGSEQLLSEAGSLLFTNDMEAWARAERLTAHVLERSPDNFMAMSLHGAALTREAWCGYGMVKPEVAARAIELARSAVRLNAESDFAHAALGTVLILTGACNIDVADREFERSLELNPMFAMGLVGRALIQIVDSDPRTGIATCRTALDALGDGTYSARTAQQIAVGYFVLGEYPEAVDWARRAEQWSPGYTQALIFLASAAAQAGDETTAEHAVAELLAKHPEITVAAIAPFPFKDPAHWDSVKDGLCRAGLPIE